MIGEKWEFGSRRAEHRALESRVISPRRTRRKAMKTICFATQRRNRTTRTHAHTPYPLLAAPPPDEEAEAISLPLSRPPRRSNSPTFPWKNEALMNESNMNPLETDARQAMGDWVTTNRPSLEVGWTRSPRRAEGWRWVEEGEGRVRARGKREKA